MGVQWSCHGGSNVNGQVDFDDHEKEALVFVHGFNTSICEGLKLFADFMAMGNFPNWVHPFMFSWPVATTLYG